MKSAVLAVLVVTGASLMPAATIETISFNLSPLHAGSTLTGTFTLPDVPLAGNTASVSLSFSDPGNYSPVSLAATLSVISGTPSGYAIDFSPLSFTNLSGVATPINTQDVSLTRTAFAMCTAFPCSATGLFQDRNPAVFTSTYTIAALPVPEPSYALLVLMLAALFLGSRLVGRQIGSGRLSSATFVRSAP